MEWREHTLKGRLLGFLLALVALSGMPAITRAQANTDTSQQQQQQPDLSSAIESLRADIRADKVAVIKAAMQFTPQESEAFWPIYNKYADELSKVGDSRVAVVKEYATKYDTLTDADALSLTSRMFSFEEHRTEVRKKYLKEFSSKLSGK